MLKFFLLIVAVYSAFSLFMYLKQRDMMYFPVAENQWLDAESVWIESGNDKIKVWQINQGKDAIIYFGGNAEAVEYNIPQFSSLFEGFSVYLVNYRCHVLLPAVHAFRTGVVRRYSLVKVCPHVLQAGSGLPKARHKG